MLKKIIKKLFRKPFELGYLEGQQAGQEGRERLTASYQARIAQLTSEVEALKKPDSWMVDPLYVFSVTPTGVIQLGGQQVTSQELRNLKSEVRALSEFQVYKVLQHTLRQKAIEKAVLTPTDLYSPKGNEQILAGKMMVFSLDIIKTIVQEIDKSKITR